jgi:hypothetical protein
MQQMDGPRACKRVNYFNSMLGLLRLVGPSGLLLGKLAIRYVRMSTDGCLAPSADSNGSASNRAEKESIISLSITQVRHFDAIRRLLEIVLDVISQRPYH